MLRLAVPAFLTLIVEPLFLLADTAIVGHLGTQPLAGLGVASVVLLTAAGVFVFLAYGTTAIVARQVGAGSRDGALTAGLDGTWLALLLGLLIGTLVAALARPLCQLFGASPAALEQATTYLRISAAGLPGMLVILATTGVLRGLQDTRTPLVASVVGFSANIALNLALVYGLGWGIAGSAAGTVIAQTGMAVALVTVLVRFARGRRPLDGIHHDLPLRPHPGRVLRAARDGIPLLVRTLALRAVLVTTTWVAAGLGDGPLAAHQVAMTLWSVLVFALDAIAIAAQALTGKALGAGNLEDVRAATTMMIRWGTWLGVLLGAVVFALHAALPALFTPDPLVRRALAAALIVVALGQPLSGFVFVIDGVLIGAGDGRWLARAMVLNYVAYLPLVWGVHRLGPTLLTGSPHEGYAVTGGPGRLPSAVGWLDHPGPERALVVLWVAFTGFMAIRALLLWRRVRTDTWMVTGPR